jgi:hypothetical protein
MRTKDRIGHGTMKEEPPWLLLFPPVQSFIKLYLFTIFKALFKGVSNPLMDRHLGMELARLCAELARFCATTCEVLR